MVSDKQTEVRDDRSYNDVQWVVFENVREKNKYAHRGPFGHQFGQRYVGVIRLGAVYGTGHPLAGLFTIL